MPPPLKTKVEYDVSQAMTELTKLSNRIDQLEGKSTKNFNNMAKASGSFESAIRLVNPRAAELLTNVTRVTTGGFLPMIAAAGGAAVAIGGIVAALVDVPELTQRSDDRLKAFAGTLNDLAQTQQAVRSIDFASNISEFNESLRQLREIQGSQRGEQAGLKDLKASLQDQLDGYKDHFNEINKLAEESANRRRSLEARLASIQERLFLKNVSQLPLGQQIRTLIEEAEKAQSAGRFDVVERLLSQADQSAQRSGNAFVIRQVAEAQADYVEGLKSAISDTQRQEESQHRMRTLIEAQSGALESQIDILERRDQIITNNISRLRDLLAQIEQGRQRALDTDKANQAAIEYRNTLREINQLAGDNFTEFDKAAAALKALPQAGLGLFGGAFGDLTFEEQSKQIDELIKKARNAATQIKGGTAADARRGAVEAQEVLDRLAEIQLDGEFSSGFQVFINRISSIAQKTAQAGREAASFVEAGRGPLQQIQEQSERTVTPFENLQPVLDDLKNQSKEFSDNLKSAASSGERLHRLNAVNIPGTPAQGAGGATNIWERLGVPDAAGPVNTSTTVNVNANVRGGLIDNETASSIMDLVNRGIRQGLIQLRQPPTPAI